MKKVVLIGALPESLTNFRGPLLQEFVDLGLDVYAMAAPASEEQRAHLKALGVTFIEFPVQRNGLNPIQDLKTWWVLRRELQNINPDLVLAYTIKPVIWGGLALTGNKKVKFYALITGLGFAFQGQGPVRNLLKIAVSSLYKYSLMKASSVIFQNKDDQELFIARGIVPSSKSHIVNGSGVDTGHFSPARSFDGAPTFLTMARLLAEKGLRVYADAARRVKQTFPHVKFKLLGAPDPSPDGIPLDEVMRWDAEGVVEYLGETNDVRPHLAACHVFVLASYYGEGLPRTIIEAMAMGKPILTTDNVGCRETVIPGENGFLVPVKDANALAERIIWFIEHQDDWQRMGDASRKLAVEKFDVKKINAKMLKIMGLDG